MTGANSDQRFREAAPKGGRTHIPNVEDVWQLEEHANVAEWRRLRGWDVSVAHSDELLAHYRRTVDDDVADAMPPSLFITERRPPRGIVSDAAEGVS